jgi:hypothetical protein
MISRKKLIQIDIEFIFFFYKSHIVTKLKKDKKITLKYIVSMCIIQGMFITKNEIEILIYNSNLNIL